MLRCIFHNVELIMINHPSLEVHLCDGDPRNINSLSYLLSLRDTIIPLFSSVSSFTGRFVRHLLLFVMTLTS